MISGLSRRHRTETVLVGYLVLTAAFVGPAVWGHGWYGPADIGQAAVLTHLAGAGSAKNPLLSDPYTTVDPVMRYVVDQVRSGHLPTWNPFDGNGVPLLADDQAAVFSPFTALHYILPFGLANAWAAVAELWLMATATFCWLRHHLRGDLGPAVGGAVMAFAGYQLIWLDWEVMAASALALPLGLWAVRAALDARTTDRVRTFRLALAGLAGAVALSVLGGHAETAAFADLTLAAYTVGSVLAAPRIGQGRPGTLLRLAGAAVLGIGMSAVVLLPLLRYESVSQRSADLASDPSAVTVGYHPSSAATITFPNLFGGPQLDAQDPGFYGPMVPNYAEGNSDTVGLAIAALAPLGLLGWRRRRGTRWLVGFAVVAVVAEGFALYTRVAGHLWAHLPLLGRTDLNRSQDVGLLGVAVLVAVGVDAVTGWAAPAPTGRIRRAALPAVSLVVVAAIAVVAAARLLHHVGVLHGTEKGAGALVTRNVEFEVGAAVVVVAVVTALAVLRRPRVHLVLAALLVAAVAASAAIPLRSFDPTVASAAAYPQTTAITAVRRLVGTAPTLWLGSSLPPANTNLWFGLGDAGTYDGLDLARHDQLYDRVLHLPTTGTAPARTESLPACVEGLQVLGVHWVVGALAGALALHPKATVDGETVSAVPGAGTYQLIGSSSVIGNEARALATVASCKFRPDRTVVLDGGAPTSSSPTASSVSGDPVSGDPASGDPASGDPVPGRVRVVSAGVERNTLTVTAAHPAWLLIRQSWAPGWSAKVDGHPVTLRRADVAFQAVAVPAGTHQVVLAYRAPGLDAGIEVAIVAFVLELLLVAAAFTGPDRTGRHRRRTA